MDFQATRCNITLYSSDETRALGRRLGKAAKSGVTIALCGDLGSGKTTLTQGIAQGMGIAERVTSPTFTLVNEYWSHCDQQLIHIDTYRLGDTPEQALLEAETFGLDELLAGAVGTEEDRAVVVIEWAERVASHLPADHLRFDLVRVGADPDIRQIECTAFGAASAVVLASGLQCDEA